MKVLYIISTLQKSGPVNILYNIIKHLKNTEVTILTLSTERENSMLEEFKKLNIEILSLDNKFFKEIITNEKKIKRIIEEKKIEIIHAMCFRSILILAILKTKAYKCATIHGMFYKDFILNYGRVYGKILCFIYEKSLYRMNEVVSVSNSLHSQLQSNGFKKHKIILNGIDLEKFPLIIPKNNDTKNFICLDRVDKGKNTELVIKAFYNCFKKGEAILNIVGSGKEMNNLKRYEITDFIVFKNFVNNPQEELKKSDIYISASETETFHLSMVEAISMGLNVIVSDIDVHKEILEKIPNIGIVFKNKEQSSLERALKNYNNISLIKKDLLDFNRFREEVSAKRMSAEYLEFYSNFLKNRRIK